MRAKMIFFLLMTVLITESRAAFTSEEICDPHELTMCVYDTRRTQVKLPRTEEELDKYCLFYDIGMSCMDTWMKRCLHTDRHQLVQEKFIGARALIEYLCSKDTALRTDFLTEQPCWSLVSPVWSRCIDRLQVVTRHISGDSCNISERSCHMAYFNITHNTAMCCARDAFVSCVGHAGSACPSVADALLRRLTWMLAEEVAAYSPDDEEPLASHPHFLRSATS